MPVSRFHSNVSLLFVRILLHHPVEFLELKDRIRSLGKDLRIAAETARKDPDGCAWSPDGTFSNLRMAESAWNW